MKGLIQLSLLGIIFVIAILFYKSYFFENKSVKQEEVNDIKNQPSDKTIIKSNETFDTEENKIENNQIKNLVYKVDYSENGKYEIKAKLSKLNYAEGTEVVSMLDVSAFIVDENSNRIDIKSNNALLNTKTYKTSFFGDVHIKYLGSIITSNKLDFNFQENFILVSENILYKNINTKISADNVKIHLLRKEIEVYMNNSKDKIELIHIK